MLKIYLISLLNLVFAIASINGDCTVLLQQSIPLVVKSFGSRKIMFREKSETPLTLATGESMHAYCGTNLKISTSQYDDVYMNYINEDRVQSIDNIEIECLKGNIIRYRNSDVGLLSDFEYRDEYAHISCIEHSQQYLYESEKALENCHHMSYAIGMPVPNFKDIVTAGLCYDLDALDLKFINYIARRPKYEFASNSTSVPTNVASVTLNKKLNNLNQYFRFMSNSTFQMHLKEKQSKLPLLQSFEFDFDSIIQEPALKSAYVEYSDMLNTIWWRNLRIGNWKLFFETLEERAKRINYNMYLGAAGNLSIPTTGCSRTENFMLKDDDISVQAPQYIWAYLQSLQANVSEEFVVIGINSPYVQAVSDELFCKDMCSEINWLQNTLFGRMRLMPTMGVMFCCHPAEVAAKIDNFPYEMKTAIRVAETTSMPDYKNKAATTIP